MRTFSTYDSTVNSFYLAFYGRPADPAGLAFWSQQLAAHDGDLGAITQAFASSEEAQVRFGTDSVAERIAEIYQHLFNRAPDDGGMAFWTVAVANGHASLADVSVAILKGAQGSDASLSQLRQQAADAFTAQVEAEGSQYSGYASIEAARILVRAVTPTSSADDLAALVKAAVSFADSATKNPLVVEAIAVNTTLLKLFDTARGTQEPVALAQALADTAKAAAGDPVTLESLLRGGGMDKVLKVMPSNATLQDVVKALAEGGLPAAVEVVYPSAPSVPEPAFSLKLSFETVTQELGLDKQDDNVTNQKVADVTFSYTGRDLQAGQHFEYSLDGKNWITSDIEVDAGTNTVVLKNVHLVEQGFGKMARGPLPQDDVTIWLHAVDQGGKTSTPFKQTIIVDTYVAAPSVELENDSQHRDLGSDHDMVTDNATLVVTNLEPGATVDYLVVPQQQSKNTIVINEVIEEWTDKPVYQQGLNTVKVRVTDVAGNQKISEVTFTLDSEAPSAPTIALANDTGSEAHDSRTNDGTVTISGLEKSNNTAWEYSTDGGKDWVYGGVNGTTGKATLDLGADDAQDGVKNVIVRQFDAAGNVGKQSEDLTFMFDTTAPAIEFGFLGVSGSTKEGSKVTTLDVADVEFSYSIDDVEEGMFIEYRVGGEWTALPEDGYGESIVIRDVDLTQSDPTVEVRLVDSTGNAGKEFSVVIDGPYSKDSLTVDAQLGASSISIASSVAGALYLSADGKDVALTNNGSPILVGSAGADVGVQQKAVSGVFKVKSQDAQAVDQSGKVFGLGTNGNDDMLSGNHVLGFGGNDDLIGTDDSDYLDGGAGNDTVFGGKSGDQILVTGKDTLVYTDKLDSNLSIFLTPPSPNAPEPTAMSFDMVYVLGQNDSVIFNFEDLPFTVKDAHKAAVPLTGFGSSPMDFVSEIDSQYFKVATSDYDAVLFQLANIPAYMLVVNDGDDVIDGSDLVILIGSIGSDPSLNDVWADGSGNVHYGPMPD